MKKSNWRRYIGDPMRVAEAIEVAGLEVLESSLVNRMLTVPFGYLTMYRWRSQRTAATYAGRINLHQV